VSGVLDNGGGGVKPGIHTTKRYYRNLHRRSDETTVWQDLRNIRRLVPLIRRELDFVPDRKLLKTDWLNSKASAAHTARRSS
jgi:hypothetical protein